MEFVEVQGNPGPPPTLSFPPPHTSPNLEDAFGGEFCSETKYEDGYVPKRQSRITASKVVNSESSYGMFIRPDDVNLYIFGSTITSPQMVDRCTGGTLAEADGTLQKQLKHLSVPDCFFSDSIKTY